MNNEVKTKILILSDTHGDFEIINIIKDYENPNWIIHCGDHGLSEDELDSLGIIYVCGNNDWIGELEKFFSIENFNFALTHSHIIDYKQDLVKGLYNRYQEKNIDFILYGHTHIQSIQKINNVYLLNPGSLAYPRNKNKQKTYIILNVYQNNKFDILIKYLN